MRILIIMCLMFGTLKSQTIDELLQSGNIAELEQAEAKINGDLQSQITYNRELLNNLINQISELKSLHKVKEVTEVESKPEIVLRWIKLKNKSNNDAEYLVSKLNETQLIEIGNYYGFEWTTAGSKKSKVIELLKK